MVRLLEPMHCVRGGSIDYKVATSKSKACFSRRQQGVGLRAPDEAAQLALSHDALLCVNPPPRRRRNNPGLRPHGSSWTRWPDDHSSGQPAAPVQGRATESLKKTPRRDSNPGFGFATSDAIHYAIRTGRMCLPGSSTLYSLCLTDNCAYSCAARRRRRAASARRRR